MAGRLNVEGDEDVPLVENAAAASLFSPGMWVQRPHRTPRAVAGSSRDAELADQRGTVAAGGSGTQRQGSMGSPLADPDLAYLNITDERESAEKEYLKQDSEHMEALEEAYGRLREQNRAMEQQLKGVVAAVNDVVDENHTIKQLLAMLQVRREDFVFNPQQTIAAQQEAIGLRLLRNLEGSPQPSEKEQEDEDQEGPQQQRQQQQQWAAIGAQQQEQQQQQESQPGAPPSAGPMLLDMSPGGLLPLSTPASFLRTMSPKIGALRFDLAATSGDPAAAAPSHPLPAVVPASPYDFPAESQIAAAALTAKQGDTAAALLTLLDKAIEGRVDRQAQAQQMLSQVQAAAAAPQHPTGSQPQQEQEQQVYRM